MTSKTSSKPLHIQLSPWAESKDYLRGKELISINVGPTGELYILAVAKSADYRDRRKSGVSFAKINPSKPNKFTILCIDDKQISSFKIEDQDWNYHAVQPLPNGEFLLVCARSRYRGPDDYDLNGKVFSLDGRLKREFLLGDGIQDVQATSDGNIWVSYFDEGVFGNYGWGGANNRPIGASGLIMWNKFGEKLYEFSPPGGLDRIADCYALNVVDNRETWFYYYTQFPLVRLRDEQDYSFWNNPVDPSKAWAVGGSSRFAVWENLVLFCCGYKFRQLDKYQVVELMENHKMKLRTTYRFVDEQGNSLKDSFIVSRDRWLFLVNDTRYYRVDLAELLGA